MNLTGVNLLGAVNAARNTRRTRNCATHREFGLWSKNLLDRKLLAAPMISRRQSETEYNL